jgi:hypothetical protein
MILDEDVYLEHYGKKGMKWGQRRQQNRALNKASRKKDVAKIDKEIDIARKRLDSGRARQDYLKAKAQYKTNKAELGSREARKILNKVKAKNYQDYNLSIQAKSGKETTKAVLAVVGLTALSVVLSNS